MIMTDGVVHGCSCGADRPTPARRRGPAEHRYTTQKAAIGRFLGGTLIGQWPPTALATETA